MGVCPKLPAKEKEHEQMLVEKDKKKKSTNKEQKVLRIPRLRPRMKDKPLEGKEKEGVIER